MPDSRKPGFTLLQMLTFLKLFNFRNYNNSELCFEPGLNILLGDNGQGKTNILEAVYYLSLLRSFRTNRASHLKQWQKDGFYIGARCCQKDGEELLLSIAYGAERKLSLNSVPIHKTSEFIGRFVCSSFIPEDMEIVKGAALLRRRFLDIALSQQHPVYLQALQLYTLALKNRNIMLRDPQKYPRNTVTAYDYSLVENALIVEKFRQDFIEKLNLALLEQSELFFGKQLKLSLKYASGITTNVKLPAIMEEDGLAAVYHEVLRRNYERDCRDGATRYGPHRSEMNCLFSGNLLSAYGSEGQCRIAALALRFACMKIMQLELKNQDLTLIVDDVIGELDNYHRGVFLQQLQDFPQIILACTQIPKEIKQTSRVFQVKGGNVAVLE